MGLFSKKKEKEKPEEIQEEHDNTGSFAGFVLLDEPVLDMEVLENQLSKDWGFEFSEENTSRQEQTLVTEIKGMTVAISLMPAPVPNDEAVENAKTNFRWPEAVEVTQKHKAHILVAILRGKQQVLTAGKLFVMICSSCLKMPHAIAMNTLGTVFQPEFYMAAAKSAFEEEELPLLNLVFFGIYSNDGTSFSGYTYGMDILGKKNIEIIDSKNNPNDVFEFLFDITSYVLESDVTLKDGETIGFTAEQKLPIALSAGVVLDEPTLKIGF